MGAHRTAWHYLFTFLLRRHGPRWLEVRDEVPLSDAPHRLDYLLLRRLPEIPADDPGETLRGLWPLLPPTTIAELKTVSRPFRSRNLDRLFGYLHLYYSADDGGDAPLSTAPSNQDSLADTARPGRRPRAVEHASNLAGLLIVPARTPTLEQEVRQRGLTWLDLGGGYAELTGGLFRLFVAEIDVVADTANDEMVGLFGHDRGRTLDARHFWAELVGTKEAMMAVQELEDYEEVVRRFLALLPPEKRMEGIEPEQRVAGLAPEQVVRAMGPDQLLPAMPDEMLRALSEEFIDKLPEPTRSAVRKRLGR